MSISQNYQYIVHEYLSVNLKYMKTRTKLIWKSLSKYCFLQVHCLIVNYGMPRLLVELCAICKRRTWWNNRDVCVGVCHNGSRFWLDYTRFLLGLSVRDGIVGNCIFSAFCIDGGAHREEIRWVHVLRIKLGTNPYAIPHKYY